MIPLYRYPDNELVEINPVMLKVARQSRGYTITGLAKLIPGLGYRRLKRQENWNPRIHPPRLIMRAELREIARILNYPESFFKQWDVIYLAKPISVHGRSEEPDKV